MYSVEQKTDNEAQSAGNLQRFVWTILAAHQNFMLASFCTNLPFFWLLGIYQAFCSYLNLKYFSTKRRFRVVFGKVY